MPSSDSEDDSDRCESAASGTEKAADSSGGGDVKESPDSSTDGEDTEVDKGKDQKVHSGEGSNADSDEVRHECDKDDKADSDDGKPGSDAPSESDEDRRPDSERDESAVEGGDAKKRRDSRIPSKQAEVSGRPPRYGSRHDEAKKESAAGGGARKRITDKCPVVKVSECQAAGEAEAGDAESTKKSKAPLAIQKKLLAALPAGYKTCMGELMSQLKKSRTEGDDLVGKKVRRHHRDVERGEDGKVKKRKLRRRLPKLHCGHAFCEKLMARFHTVVMEREASGNPVELKLSQVAEQLHSVIAQHIEATVDRMLEAAEAECPHVLLSAVQQAIRSASAERVRLALPADQVRSALQQRAGSELAERVNELHVAVAAQVSDRVVDEVIESLTRSYQELTGDAGRKRACTPDVLKSHPRPPDGAEAGGADSSHSKEDVGSERSDPSPPATPQLHAKKLNLQGRKMRPKSVVDSVEGVSAERIPDLLPSLDATEEEVDTVAELPASAYQLRHLGKARPRRAKSRAPTRPVVGEEGADVDTGLDVFFPPARSLPSSPLTSPDSESRQLMTTSADNTPHLGLERARRTPAHRDDDAHREKKSSSGVKKGISSVFSKLAADRVARSREDRDGGEPAKPRKPADTADSDSSAGSGSADSFLNHLLSPPVVPPAEEGAEPALRRPAGLAGTDLLAEMRAKQEKRASLTPKHTPEELEERSPLQEVKGRSAALAAALKSPSAGHHGPPSISGGNTSGDETPPADVGPSSDSWTGRQMADGAAANSSSRASDSPTESAGELS